MGAPASFLHSLMALRRPRDRVVNHKKCLVGWILGCITGSMYIQVHNAYGNEIKEQ